MHRISHVKWPTRIKSDGRSMGCMFGIGFNKSSIWAVTDHSSHRVHVYNADDELIKIGNKGKVDRHFDYPIGLAFDNKNCLYVTTGCKNLMPILSTCFSLVMKEMVMAN